MQIQSIKNSTSFKGFRYSGKALCATDIDGTRAHNLTGHNEVYINLLKKIHAVSSYVTGRPLHRVEALLSRFKQQGINLPMPEILVARNGLHIYDKVNGKMVQDDIWEQKLTAKFGPQKKSIREVVNDFAFKKENILKDNYSKICNHKFWPENNHIKYMCDGTLSKDIDTIFETLLQKANINAKVVKQKYSIESCKKYFTPQQMREANLRLDSDNRITEIDITAANKGDAVEYLKERLNIPYREIITAGDDTNDKGLVDLTKNGMFFIQMKNSTPEFSEYINKFLKSYPKTFDYIIKPSKEGVAGLIEGINKLLQG